MSVPLPESVKPEESPFRELMKKNQIQSIMVTALYMERSNLITKDTMKKYCQEYWREKLPARDFHREKSINDDLETVLDDLKRGKLPTYYVDTYFLPELTEVEMTLVEKNDPSFRKTFRQGFWAGENSPQRSDLDQNEIGITASTSKFILTRCGRSTYRIVLTPEGRTSHSFRRTNTEDYYDRCYSFSSLIGAHELRIL